MRPGDWKGPAGDYRGEVHSVYHLDREGKVRRVIEGHGSPGRRAIDLGCGVGMFTPLLAERFGEVHACDYSEDMLAAARKRCAKLRNTSFERADLARRAPAVAPADFVLCVNVLLTPSLTEREGMWNHLAAALAPGGQAALVLPSLESGLLARHRLVEWNLRSGNRGARALRTSFGSEDRDGAAVARGGVLDAGGMATKHYLREEIESTAARCGLRLASCEKIEYPWNTEFVRPPRWMAAPFPWDWLALLEREG